MLPQGFNSSYPETTEILPGGGLFWGGVILSLLLHLSVFLLLLWHPDFAKQEPEPPPAPPVEMVYEAPPKAETVRSPIRAKVPAPPAPQENKAPPSLEPPQPDRPISPPPPSPPPPMHANPVPQVMRHQVPKEEKVVTHEKSAEKPVEERHLESKIPLHMDLSQKGELHNMHEAKPKKTQVKEKTQTKTSEKEDKNPKQKTPSPHPSSHTSQTHDMPKTQEDSHSLLSTLESFRSEQKQTHPPTSKANSAQGGSPHGGGSPDGDTRALSVAQQKAIGTSVRRCYQEDTAAKDYAHFVAHLIVTVDSTGVARLVRFSSETMAHMQSDASYRALAERARDAVLSPTCAHLPIPSKLLGQTRQLNFVFRP